MAATGAPAWSPRTTAGTGTRPPAWREDHNAPTTIRAHAQHTLAPLRTWKPLRDHRPRDGAHHAMPGITHPHTPTPAG